MAGDDKFYIFDVISNTFYKILLDSVHSVQSANNVVKKNYLACNGALATPPNTPTKPEKDAMSSVLNWCWFDNDEQVTMNFAPNNVNTRFFQCFKEKMDLVVQKDQQEAKSEFETIGVILAVAFFLMACFAFGTYMRNKQKKSNENSRKNYTTISGNNFFKDPSSEKDDISTDKNSTKGYQTDVFQL